MKRAPRARHQAGAQRARCWEFQGVLAPAPKKRPPAGEEPTESMSRTGAERLRTVSRRNTSGPTLLVYEF
jgi:hypothetical protein